MPRIPTRTVAQVDDYFGTAVPDPYRWLEDTDDPEVVAWLSAQAAHARQYLDALPGRAPIVAALRRVVGLPSSGLPERHGALWFRTSNDGVQQQSVLRVADTPMADGRVLVDPNPLSPDASISLVGAVPNRDGSLIAYSYSEAGSDWRTWRVRETATGADRTDEVRWAKFGWPAWLPDGSGFVYARFAAPSGDEYVSSNRGQWLALHRLGADQDDDEVVFALPDQPDMTFAHKISEDGRWLTIQVTRGTEQRCRVWVRDLADPQGVLRPLIAHERASWQVLGSVGSELLMITDLDAPFGRVVAVDAETAAMREVVGQRADTLEDGVLAGGRLVLHWLHDASSQLTVHDLAGAPVAEVALPGLGTVVELTARADDSLTHIGYTSFADPPAVLSYDVASGRLAVAFAPEPPEAPGGPGADGAGGTGGTGGAGGAELVTDRIWATSADGTRVPVFVLHRADVTPATGPHPAWLYGYGGFRIAMTPQFEPTRFAFAAAGGVVAVACLRGGGEYGATWHDAGRLAHKQNVFDDAIAAAEQLVRDGWTSTAQLGASGRSNGGLLAGAVLTQRPELFAAVVPEVGVLDMLRYPLWTIGWAWISDFGDPRADREQFQTLHAYSPLHQLRADAGYPPVLVLTSDHDDRVVPAHSIKFAAQLQAVSPPDAVALLRVEASGGHKEGRSHDALVAERADVLAFLSRHTGLAWA
jgi:prolyl oligopeptidase